MKPPIETVRLSAESRDKLIQLKRITGVKHWNVLCRWALCLSIPINVKPQARKTSEKSQIEMAWGTFAGENSDVYSAVVITGWKAAQNECPLLSLSDYFHSCIEHGIGILLKTIQGNPHGHICGLLLSGKNAALDGNV